MTLAALASDGADVVVKRDVALHPEQVYGALTDVVRMRDASNERCMRKWDLGDMSTGEGANFRVTYLFEGYRRPLDVVVTVAKPNRVEWDHKGNRGWVTRFKMKPSDIGTHLTVHTYLDEPPWPLRGYFKNKVRPAWHACYEHLIDGIVEQAKQLPAPPQPSEAPEPVVEAVAPN